MDIIVNIIDEGLPVQVALIEVRGHLDASTSETIKTAILTVVEKERYNLVIDLKHVSFIDSSGLSALVSGFKTVRKHDGVLVLASVSLKIKVALELTRLDRVFVVYDNVATALASFERQKEVG